jgi:hypothetical protein
MIGDNACEQIYTIIRQIGTVVKAVLAFLTNCRSMVSQQGALRITGYVYCTTALAAAIVHLCAQCRAVARCFLHGAAAADAAGLRSAAESEGSCKALHAYAGRVKPLESTLLPFRSPNGPTCGSLPPHLAYASLTYRCHR